MYRSLIIELVQIAPPSTTRSAPRSRSRSRPPPRRLVLSRLRVQWRYHWEAPASVPRPGNDPYMHQAFALAETSFQGSMTSQNELQSPMNDQYNQCGTEFS
jgi:hypothetical protein